MAVTEIVCLIHPVITEYYFKEKIVILTCSINIGKILLQKCFITKVDDATDFVAVTSSRLHQSNIPKLSRL